MRIRLLTLTLVASFGTAQRLAGQAERVVVRGSVVRFAGPADGAAVEGTVVRIWGDTLTVRPRDGGGVAVVPVSPDRPVLLFTGRRASFGRGAVVGGVVGIIIGGLAGVAAGRECRSGDFLCANREHHAIERGLILVGAGVVIGGTMAVLTRKERWTRIERVARPAGGALTWGLGPAQGGAGLAVGVQWGFR